MGMISRKWMGMMLRTNHTENTESPGRDTDRRELDLGCWRNPRVLEWKHSLTVRGCPGPWTGCWKIRSIQTVHCVTRYQGCLSPETGCWKKHRGRSPYNEWRNGKQHVDLDREIRGYESMRKPWILKEEGNIGVEEKGLPNAQRNDMTQPLTNQLGVSIIQIRKWNWNKVPWTRSWCSLKTIRWLRRSWNPSEPCSFSNCVTNKNWRDFRKWERRRFSLILPRIITNLRSWGVEKTYNFQTRGMIEGVQNHGTRTSLGRL